MTRQSTVFEVERPVPVNDIVKDQQPETRNQSSTDDSARAAVPGKRFNFRKVLMAGAAPCGACGRGVVRLGLLDRRPISGLDR